MTVWTPAELLAAYRQLGAAESVTLEKPLDLSDDVRGLVERAYVSGRRFDPVFTYAPSDPAGSQARDELRRRAGEAAAATGDSVTEAFAVHLDAQAAWLSALRSHEAAAIDAASIAQHGPVRAALVAEATAMLGVPVGEPAAPSVPVDEAARVLDAVLVFAGAAGWSCQVRDDLVARMRVSHARRQVELSAAVTFSHPEVVRLAVHEVGVHVLRGVNGAAQANPLLGLGLSVGYLGTEEGLAVWAEQACGLLSAEDERKYALRVLAVDRARRGGFFDVYAFLRDYLSPAPAFDLAVRVKRGIAVSGEPGAYVKDKVYLEGSRRVAAAVTADADLLPLLCAGKVSLEFAPMARALADSGVLVVPPHDPRQVWLGLAALASGLTADGS